MTKKEFLLKLSMQYQPVSDENKERDQFGDDWFNTKFSELMLQEMYGWQ